MACKNFKHWVMGPKFMEREREKKRGLKAKEESG
jgi:spore cortex formation protein SpoVR/YcgB (stage V sporulation)